MRTLTEIEIGRLTIEKNSSNLREIPNGGLIGGMLGVLFATRVLKTDFFGTVVAAFIGEMLFPFDEDNSTSV